MDECIKELSLKGISWFGEMGSIEIYNIEYRQGFAFIAIQGKKDHVFERRAILKSD